MPSLPGLFISSEPTIVRLNVCTSEQLGVLATPSHLSSSFALSFASITTPFPSSTSSSPSTFSVNNPSLPPTLLPLLFSLPHLKHGVPPQNAHFLPSLPPSSFKGTLPPPLLLLLLLLLHLFHPYLRETEVATEGGREEGQAGGETSIRVEAEVSEEAKGELGSQALLLGRKEGGKEGGREERRMNRGEKREV